MTISSTVRALITQAAAPYRAAGHYAWRFAAGKLGGDPVFVHLLAQGFLAGRTRILDIGCGQGLLTSWLLSAQQLAAQGHWPSAWAAAPHPQHIQGIELMPHDVQRALAAMPDAVQAGRVGFVAGDMCRTDFAPVDAVVILDVLHYVPIAAQDEVLRRVKQALAPGGVLLLRIGDAGAGWPFRFSNWVDFVVTTLRGHRLGALHCRPLSAWVDALRALGFTVMPQPMSQGTLFANVLLVAHL
ncbi:MAG: class I SAM-dependent methyltransferase [Rhodoferax sp.]|uniref:class I SAM-dependent methyltransferase n=1 Tax=Rhodoferax sp. TaxID=50421 RepID=UPI00326323E9